MSTSEGPPRLEVDGIDVPGILRTGPLGFERGACTAILGPSGSGKSTLLGVLAGTIGGGSSLRRRGRLGVMLQADALWNHLRVVEHLRLVGATGDRADELLASTGLHHLAARRPPRLSGGERRRLALARALAVDPDWLLLDEPMAHLDGPARRATLEAVAAVRTRRPEMGVVLATHHPAEAMGLADRLVVLDRGAVRQSGPPESLFRAPVDLGVARMLGPASLIGTRIVRPSDIRFVLGDAADAIAPAGKDRVVAGRVDVIGCRFAGDGWHLELQSSGASTGHAADDSGAHLGVGDDGPVICRSATAVPVGTHGRLVLIEPE